MRNTKYPLLALANILCGIFLIIAISTIGFQVNTYFLTGVILTAFGLFGFFQIIKARGSNDIDDKDGLESWYELTKSVDVIFIIALAIRIFVFQPYIVEGTSMEPNFKSKEFILVERVSYRMREPARGDVIVFHPPGDQNINYIKRVIAVAGETIEIDRGKISIDGRQLNEDYLTRNYTNTEQARDRTVKYTLGDDQYFVLGDNRDNSSDSRVFGPIAKNTIIGKAFVVVLPISQFQIIRHSSYDLSPISAVFN